MVVKKEHRDDEGFKQFTSNYITVSEEMKPGFGATKHFDPRSKDGKDADAGNNNYTYIQEFICSLTKVNFLENCIVSYDLKSILMIRELCNASHVDA